MKYLLTVIPFIWIIASLPFGNTFHPQIAGLPFLAFWIQAGVIVTVACIHTLWVLDKKDRLRSKKEM